MLGFALLMGPRTLEDDRRYCREVLPRVSRTFALNIRLLPGSFREAVGVAYLLCRTADAFEDTLIGSPDEIRGRFDALLRALEGDAESARPLAREAETDDRLRSDLELVSNLPRVLNVYGALHPDDREAALECLRAMCAGMSRYAARAAERGAAVPYLDDTGELRDYCWVVAGCVGVMLTRMFSRRSPARDAREEARRYELAPVVGEALQLTNILLDWPSDLRRGRCYVPAEWLAAHGLKPRDLVGAERPGVRELEARLESLARESLARVPDYVALVPRRALRYRLFVLWPALWALRSLEHARLDPSFPWGESRPKLPRAALWRAALGAVLAGNSAAALRTPAHSGALSAGARP